MQTPANLPFWVNVGPISAYGAGLLNLILVFAVIGGIGGWLLIAFARRSGRRDIPSCPSCGHDLRGHEAIPERCPECGATVDPTLVHGGRLSRLTGIRNAIRWTGRSLVVAGILVVAAVMFVHPVRLSYTPTGLLVTADLWWSTRLLQIDHRSHRPPRDVAGMVFQEIDRRGKAGRLSDAEVGKIARRFLDQNGRGTRLEDFEQDLVGLALLVDAISPAEVGAAEFMQHDVGSGRFNPILMEPQLRLGGAGRIEISQPICGWIKGMVMNTMVPDGLFQLEIEMRSITLDDQPLGVRQAHRLRWPVTGGTGRVFTILPPEGADFPAGPTKIEWDAEIRVLGPEDPEGSGARPVLRSHVFPQRLPTEVDLLPSPGIDRSNERGRALATAIEAGSVLEWDAETGEGLLVVGASDRHALELGTPTLELLFDVEGSVTRIPAPFVRRPLERPRMPGSPPPADPSFALHARVPSVRWNDESLIKVGDTVRLEFDSTDFDAATWWDRLDQVAFALGGYGLGGSGERSKDLWREVRESVGDVVATRVVVEIPVVEPRSDAAP